MIKRTALLLTLLLLLIGSTGCSPKAVPTEAPQPAEPTAPPPPPAEPVHFSVWYTSSSAEMIALQEQLTDTWASRHTDPPVEVEWTPYGYEDMNTSLRLALDSGTGPDVGYISPGGSRHLAYAKAGHLLDLTPFIEARGWDKLIPMDVMRYYEDPGDETYGVAYEVVAVGVFYNPELLASLGLALPNTLAEFEQILGTVKEAGLVPIAIGGLEGWPLMHVWEQFLHTNVPFENLTALNRMSPDGRWDTPEVLGATQKYQEWATLGYFDPNGLATGMEDALNLFMQGKAAFLIGGTWNNATLATQADFEARFFAMPPMNPGTGNHMGGYTPNNVWSIPVYTEHQDLALEYIDYMLGEEAGTTLWDLGSIPSYRFEQVPEAVYPLQADVYEATQSHSTGYYLDTAHAEIGPHIYGVLQELYAGRMTAEEAVASIQAKYEALIAEG